MLEEVPAARRQGDVQRCIDDEGERLLGRISRDDRVIALDERGSAWSSVVLSQTTGGLAHATDATSCCWSAAPTACRTNVSARAPMVSWSLSAATLPHALVRVLVAEQIYRAWTLLTGHPYHRA